MTLLITVFAAVTCTALWYFENDDTKRLGILCFMYWGAALMWSVDAIYEYADEGAAYFTPSASDMLNDAFLGLSVVALGLVIWIVRILITDPTGTLKRNLLKKTKQV